MGRIQVDNLSGLDPFISSYLTIFSVVTGQHFALRNKVRSVSVRSEGGEYRGDEYFLKENNGPDKILVALGAKEVFLGIDVTAERRYEGRGLIELIHLGFSPSVDIITIDTLAREVRDATPSFDIGYDLASRFLGQNGTHTERIELKVGGRVPFEREINPAEGIVKVRTDEFKALAGTIAGLYGRLQAYKAGVR